MLLINQIKLSLDEDESLLAEKAAHYLHIAVSDMLSISVIKKSIDARKKEHIGFIYRVAVCTANEETLYKKFETDTNVVLKEKQAMMPFMMGNMPLIHRPVIVGSGPCGLFCALLLSQYGYRPLLMERGKCVDERLADIQNFWDNGVLDENSNVQFGEGGAGTFSDGKLNTLIKDKDGFSRFVLETFVRHGAPQEILYRNKPHVGSDYLHKIIPSIRREIEQFGGEVRFQCCLTDIEIKNDTLVGITLNGCEKLECDTLILALGHSARDTFSMLHQKNVPMEQKPFAMGVRVEHLQEEINKTQYGKNYAHPKLPTADYKLTYQAKSGRGVYSFCMCPGGVVVNAASEKNTIVTNGMSYFARDKQNANSALVVNVRPEDFASPDVLAGVEFQRRWERKAFSLTKSYRAPAQTVGNFLGICVNEMGRVKPSFPCGVAWSDLHECLPTFVSESLEEALRYWQKHFAAFSDNSAIMTGVETRTSSPVRILRDEKGASQIRGIYPAGEGAGYAGGIMSAAIDGIKTARHIMAEFAPLKEESK